MQKTVMVLKPGGMLHRQAIFARLEERGFRTVRQLQMIWTPSVIETLYSHVDPVSFEKVYEYLVGSPGIGLELEREGALTHLRELLGLYADPTRCRPGTLRRKLGYFVGFDREGNRFYDNIAHASCDLVELARDLKLLDRRFSSCAPAVRI